MKTDLPVELRLYSREATLQDIASGVQWQRANDNGKLYCTAILQYRCRHKVKRDGAIAIEWSEWYGIPLVREGVEEQPLQPAGSAAGAPSDG